MDNTPQITMYFDQATEGFYPYKFKDEMIGITGAQHEEAVAARNAGGTLDVVDDQLVITLVDPGVISAKLLTQQKREYKAQVQALLTKSDLTVMRCYEAGIALPANWVAARKSWRVVVSSAIDSIDPMQPLAAVPPYPEGT